MANTFLKAKGYAIGHSLHEPGSILRAQTLLKKAQEKNILMLLPQDVIVAPSLLHPEKSSVKSINDIHKDDAIFDVGPKTAYSYQSLLTLEEKLPELVNTNLVVYGFIEHHETRNVASAEWLSILKQYSKRRHVSVHIFQLMRTMN